jgi:hypothetical protein
MEPTTSRPSEAATTIKKLWKDAGYKQSDLGELLNITTDAAGRKLRGVSEFRLPELEVVAARLGVAVAVVWQDAAA